jgi:hypothetical protein
VFRLELAETCSLVCINIFECCVGLSKHKYSSTFFSFHAPPTFSGRKRVSLCSVVSLDAPIVCLSRCLIFSLQILKNWPYWNCSTQSVNFNRKCKCLVIGCDPLLTLPLVSVINIGLTEAVFCSSYAHLRVKWKYYQLCWALPTRLEHISAPWYSLNLQ